MASKTLYLIRHAQPDYPNGEKMCLGQKNDLPLSEHGFSQARQLGAFFKEIPLEAVYTSPLLRARQTAAPIAGEARPLLVLDALIELYGGEWDGMPFSVLRERYPGYSRRGSAFSTPPGGETDESGLARALSALAIADGQTQRCAALVAHGGINRLLLCHLLGRPLSDKRQLSQDHAAVSILEKTNGVWRVQGIDILGQNDMR